MEDQFGCDCHFNEKFFDFSELASLYDNLDEDIKDCMILLEEVSENSKKLENYFETMENIVNPLITRTGNLYSIDALTSYNLNCSESYQLEIYKNFDINLPTGKRKNSNIFFSWDRNPEGLERIICGLNLGGDIHLKEFRNHEGGWLYLDEMNFIPGEDEVNDWILEQILLDKKRKNSPEYFYKHF